MNTRTFLLFIIFTLITNAQSVNEPDCDVRSIIVRSIADSSVIRQLSIEEFSARDCSLLVQRMTIIGADADPLTVSGMVESMSRAAELYSSERAGPASSSAFVLLQQRMESGDTLGAGRAGIVSEFLRPIYIREVRRALSVLADTVRRSIDLGSYAYAAILLDSLDARSRLYLKGMAYQDSIHSLRRRLSELTRRAEHEYALYHQEEETTVRFTATATFTGTYLSEISNINWTMLTVGPDMVMSIEGVRLPATLAFPVGLRFGYSLNNSVAVESEIAYSRDVQKDFRVGDYVSPAGFRRTILSGELALKYRFRTAVGLRPYITIGFSAAQLERSDFHPPRRFFDATYIGFTIISPPKEFIIPGQRAHITSYVITIGDELLLTASEGWFSDFFLGTKITGTTHGLFAGTSYVVGFRAGYAW